MINDICVQLTYGLQIHCCSFQNCYCLHAVYFSNLVADATLLKTVSQLFFCRDTTDYDNRSGIKLQ